MATALDIVFLDDTGRLSFASPRARANGLADAVRAHVQKVGPDKRVSAFALSGASHVVIQAPAEGGGTAVLVHEEGASW